MFDENQKKVYSSIKAPDELREKVFSAVDSDEKKDNIFVFRSRVSRFVAMAACLELVAVAVFTVFTDNRSMKRLIHIRLRHCYIVLESSRNRCPHSMNKS